MMMMRLLVRKLFSRRKGFYHQGNAGAVFDPGSWADVL
jgi:hypothetical protein